VANYLFNFSKKGAAKGKTLREQAAELLQVGMWGIGAKTPNRLSLASGDRVLIYVGAPEYEFIGSVELGSPVHKWTTKDAARYPGDFEGGVLLNQAKIWSHPVPIKTVLGRLDLHETNPNAQFFSGVVRITNEDYESVASVGSDSSPLPKLDQVVETVPSQVTASTIDGPIDVGLLFKTVEKLKPAASLHGILSEYDTRAEFIDKYLEALGYTELGDIRRGSPVDSGDFPDYVLHINGEPAIAIEAKKLGAPLGPKQAAQVVAYCSNLGVRWGAVTDGRYFNLYDAPLLGVSPEERKVFSVDLADYRDQDDFETRVYPELELIAKAQLEHGAGLERRVALESVRELLTSTNSKSMKALRRELDEIKHIKLSASELSELISDLLG
jgi:hypothetical protein